MIFGLFNFILLSRVTYIFSDFPASIYTYLVIFLYNRNFFWGSSPPKIFDKIEKFTFCKPRVKKFFSLVWYAKLLLFSRNIIKCT